MRFTPQFLDEIRARLPVADIVGRRVTWDRRKTQAAKGDYWACCPFHGEKTPSFHADNRKGRYHCFGCGASGDIFTFLVESEGLSFPEAVERLAGEAGLALPKADPQARERAEARASLADVLEAAARFYEDMLQERGGAAARGYLADRGVEPATVHRFRLGYAPPGRHALKEHLGARRIPVELMVAAGLLVAGDDIPVPFDRFRDRIMFPIHDPRGRIVGFGGRALGADVPAKYLNSPETGLFAKRHLLYNAHAARAPAHGRGGVVAVEGYMDVITLVQAGIENVVAPLGTALTEEQLGLLWRLADEPVLCFDGDAAGIRAASRALDAALPLLRPGRSLAFALLPAGQDPDDLVRAEGRAGFDAVLAAALPLVEMVWQREREGADFSTPERRAAFERRLGEIVRAIADETVRRHYGDEFRARVAALWARREGAGGRRRPHPAGAPAPGRALMTSPIVRAAQAPLSAREAVLVLAMISHPELVEEEAEAFGALEFAHAGLDRLRRAILDIAAHEPPPDGEALAARLCAEGHAALVGRITELARRGRERFALPGGATDEARTGWRHAAALHRKVSTLNKELASAERALAEDGSEASLARLKAIQAQIETLDGREALIEGFGS